MKKASNTISTLTALVSINSKRYESYKNASDQMKDLQSKLLFMNYAVQSQEFITSLNKWLSAYGTSYVQQQQNVFVRSWTGLKNVIFQSGTKLMLTHCELVERQSLKIYKTALNEALLPAAAVADIKKHVEELEGAYLTMKSLKQSPERLQVA